MVLLSLAVDEVAVQSELPDDGVHLTQREWRTPLEPAADKLIRVGGEAGFQGGGAGVVGECGAVFARQPRQSDDATDRYRPIPVVGLLGDRTDSGADFAAARQ